MKKKEKHFLLAKEEAKKKRILVTLVQMKKFGDCLDRVGI